MLLLISIRNNDHVMQELNEVKSILQHSLVIYGGTTRDSLYICFALFLCSVVKGPDTSMAKHALGGCNTMAPQEDMSVWEMTPLPVVQTAIEEVLPRLFPVLKPLHSAC